MSHLKKSGNFVKFLVDVKTKKQAQALLGTLTRLSEKLFTTSPVDIPIVIKGLPKKFTNL